MIYNLDNNLIHPFKIDLNRWCILWSFSINQGILLYFMMIYTVSRDQMIIIPILNLTDKSRISFLSGSYISTEKRFRISIIQYILDGSDKGLGIIKMDILWSWVIPISIGRIYSWDNYTRVRSGLIWYYSNITWIDFSSDGTIERSSLKTMIMTNSIIISLPLVSISIKIWKGEISLINYTLGYELY
jgi:hypothetical protein